MFDFLPSRARAEAEDLSAKVHEAGGAVSEKVHEAQDSCTLQGVDDLPLSVYRQAPRSRPGRAVSFCLCCFSALLAALAAVFRAVILAVTESGVRWVCAWRSKLT